MKHVLEVVVEGGAKDSLRDIESGMGRVNRQAEEMGKGFAKSGEEAEGGLNGLNNLEIGSKIQEWSNTGQEALRRLGAAGKEAFMDLIHEASGFEDSQADMRFAFGSDWTSVFEQVKKDAADLTFTFKEVSDLASSLGRMKINPFGGTTEASQIFKSKTGENIRALQVLQDTADGAGKTTQDVMVAIRAAMSGDFHSLETRFDIAKDKIKKWKEEGAKQNDIQGKYNNLVQNLSNMFGGAGLEKAQNYSKAVAQIPDILQKLKATVGDQGLKTITKPLFEFVKVFGDLVEDKSVISALSDGFNVFAQAVAFGIRMVSEFIRMMRNVLSSAPWLPKMAAYFTAATVAIGGLITAGAVLATTLIGVGMALAAIGWAPLIAATAVTAAFTAAALFLVPVIVGIGIAAKAAGDALLENFGGPIATLEKMKMVFGAINELISSYNGETATMSMETAGLLRKAGLIEFVTDLFAVFHRVSVAWRNFSDIMDTASDQLSSVVVPLFEEFGDLVDELAQAFGLSSGAMDVMNMSGEDWLDISEGIAEYLVDIAEDLIEIARESVAFVRMANQSELLRDSLEALGEDGDGSLKALISSLGVLVKMAAATAKEFIAAADAASTLYSIGKDMLGSDSGGGTNKQQKIVEDYFKRMANRNEGSFTGAEKTGKEPDKQIDPDDYRATRKRWAGKAFRDENGAFEPNKVTDSFITADDGAGPLPEDETEAILDEAARGRKKGRGRFRGSMTEKDYYGSPDENGAMSSRRGNSFKSSFEVPPPPMSVEPPTQQQGGMSSVAEHTSQMSSNLQQHTALLSQIAAGISQPTVVNLDGREIARAMKGLNMGFGG